MTGKQWAIVVGVGVAWYLFRTKTKAGASVGGYMYNGSWLTGEQARIIAEQDAAFSSGDSFIDAPFHS
jgi:hypothetical protein